MITLGINCGHDSGVTLLDGKNLSVAINEERFTRVKFQGGFPFNSVSHIKQFLNGIQPDKIVFEGRRQFPFRNINDPIDPSSNLINNLLLFEGITKLFFGTVRGVELSENIFYWLTLKNRFEARQIVRKEFGNPEIKYIEHHLAHNASSALLYNRFSGLSYSLDAFGEGYCSQIYRSEQGKLSFIAKTPGLHSPGLFYYYITRLLGFKVGQEGKITGLAAHGNPNKSLKIFETLIDFDGNSGTFKNNELNYGINSVKILAEKFKYFSQEDVAAGAQIHLENIVCKSVVHFAKLLPELSEAIFLSGGVFANVSLNRKIHELELFRNVFVTPNMGDGGLSLGAALYEHPERIEFNDLYLGPEPGDLPVHLNNYWTEEKIDLIKISQLLIKNKVIGICRGKMEFGPRSLGNRSILANASNSNINEILNNKLSRTEFMPFAPIVRREDAFEYFQLTQNNDKYENMVTTCFVTNKCILEAPAIVHKDGTARPQILSREVNPFLWELLKIYKEMSGIGVLINTSFNIHEEPIVRTANEAIASANLASLDGVIVNEKLYLR
jgi:carbamoyltransferase